MYPKSYFDKKKALYIPAKTKSLTRTHLLEQTAEGGVLFNGGWAILGVHVHLLLLGSPETTVS